MLRLNRESPDLKPSFFLRLTFSTGPAIPSDLSSVGWWGILSVFCRQVVLLGYIMTNMEDNPNRPLATTLYVGDGAGGDVPHKSNISSNLPPSIHQVKEHHAHLSWDNRYVAHPVMPNIYMT
jgi:hypothetical protein